MLTTLFTRQSKQVLKEEIIKNLSEESYMLTFFLPFCKLKNAGFYYLLSLKIFTIQLYRHVYCIVILRNIFLIELIKNVKIVTLASCFYLNRCSMKILLEIFSPFLQLLYSRHILKIYLLSDFSNLDDTLYVKMVRLTDQMFCDTGYSRQQEGLSVRFTNIKNLICIFKKFVNFVYKINISDLIVL